MASRSIFPALAVLAVAACAALPRFTPSSESLAGISPFRIEEHIRVLSSEVFDGRAPGTRGEEFTVDYLVEEFRRAGAAPGNPDGSWSQPVPLIGIASVPRAAFCVAERCVDWKFKEDYVGGSLFAQPEVSVDSELVFVGFGLVAPELRRDDYKDADVRGKTLVMLAADPPMSGGMLSHPLKRETAIGKGAAARVLVRERDDPIGPLSAYSWSAEELEVRGREGRHLTVSLVAEERKVRELMALAGHDYDALRQAALQPDFRPVSLGAKARLHVSNQVRSFVSRNVVARIEGSDPALRREHVIYVAHWDHLGRDPSRADGIYRGALDNASGVAGLLEIARAYGRLPQRPKRSVLFIATTGEEQGLLGAKHYVANPLYPLSGAIAVLNLDALNPWGPTRDFEIVGGGSPRLDRALVETAYALDKVIKADEQPAHAFYYRSDQLEFARVGVPSVWIRRGSDYVGRPPDYGREKAAAFFAHDYHQPSDVPKPDWNYEGMAEHVRYAFAVGYRLAMD